MKIAIIDNYDSFVYNLSHLVKELGAEVSVLRNDQFRMEELEAFDKILLSPGPGVPEEAGLLLDVIRTYAGKKPILGVCLGEQAIGEVYGAQASNLDTVFHGIQSPVTVSVPDYLFEGLPQRHRRQISLMGSRPERPARLSGSDCHQRRRLHHGPSPPDPRCAGVQFHPESVLTPDGKQLIGNWLRH